MASILIVDDDPLMHLLYKGQLERAGFVLFSATSGDQALKVAQQNHPDVILMDVMMPGMDGLSALRELKKDESTREVPVIIVTANVSEHAASRKEAEIGGAAGFLTKPFGAPQLLSEIRKFVPGA